MNDVVPTTNQTRILHGIGDDRMTLAGIAAEIGLSHAQASQAAALLVLRGYLERLAPGLFTLTPSGRAARDAGVRIESGVTGPTRASRKPKRATIRQRAWNAMRIKRSFTVPDLVTVVARAGDGDVAENLRRYVSALTRAGYLERAARRQQGTAPGSNGYPVYSLVRDTGEIAPVISQACPVVHDFNGGAA